MGRYRLLGPEVCDCLGWPRVALTLTDCSDGVPPPLRHSLVQACRPFPGRFRARLVSVRGRQGRSFIAEASRLSLVEEGRESGLQRVFQARLDAVPVPASGGLGRPTGQASGAGHREGSRSPCLRGVVSGWEAQLGDLLKLLFLYELPCVQSDSRWVEGGWWDDG